MSLSERIHFKMISLVHWNLFSLFVDPYRILDEAGLKEAQRVLEIGCGPGFFTLAAAKIVGEKGKVFALDVNPVAIEDVQRKIEARGLKNVETLLCDAGKTGLPDESVDVAFLFGVIHDIDGLDTVVREMHRVLKGEGVLVMQKPSQWSEKKLLQPMTENSLFLLKEKKNNIPRFGSKRAIYFFKKNT